LPLCRWWTTNQRSGLSSSLNVRKNVSSISFLARNGNGSYGTEERQRYNGTAQRNGETATAKRQWQNGNGMVETRHKNAKPVAITAMTAIAVHYR